MPIAALVVLSACSSGRSSKPAPSSTSGATSTTSTTATTTTTIVTPTTPTTLPPTSVPVSALGGPQILRLTGPATPVQCNAPTSVRLRWETRDATRVSLRIDAQPIFATYTNGSNDRLVPLACDGKAHTYTFTARANDGRTATKSLTITEHKL